MELGSVLDDGHKIIHSLHKMSVLVNLKWYYDQKIISFFCSDFESVFA